MLSTIEQIRTALASAYPITLLVSPEEDRQETLLRRFAASANSHELVAVTVEPFDDLGVFGEPGGVEFYVQVAALTGE